MIAVISPEGAGRSQALLELRIAAFARFAFARTDDERLDLCPDLVGEGGLARGAVLGHKGTQAPVVVNGGRVWLQIRHGACLGTGL